MRILYSFFISVLLISPAFALECDQFTVPPTPLVDIGPAIDARVVRTLQAVVDDANRTRADELAEVANTDSHFWQRVHTDRAHAAVSQSAIADDFYDRIAGGGLPRCKIEHWIEDTPSHAPMLQPMPVDTSIYGGSLFYRPMLMVELSATILFHGQYVGVDKTGHFFQQGHQYYETYLAHRLAGDDESAAIAAAVDRGRAQEHGFFGEAIVGVYSNGDLAANFSGLMFYRNLMESMQVGPVTLEPMIQWQGGKLALSPRLQHTVCSPFVLEQWNEAFNPCYYNGWWRDHTRDRIAVRLNAWLAFNHTTVAAETIRLKRMETIYGQDYGHHSWEDIITAANVTPPLAVAAR